MYPIDVSKLFLSLGIELSASLLAFHALTGCDFTPVFYRKGKIETIQNIRKKFKFSKAIK